MLPVPDTGAVVPGRAEEVAGAVEFGKVDAAAGAAAVLPAGAGVLATPLLGVAVLAEVRVGIGALPEEGAATAEGVVEAVFAGGLAVLAGGFFGTAAGGAVVAGGVVVCESAARLRRIEAAVETATKPAFLQKETECT